MSDPMFKPGKTRPSGAHLQRTRPDLLHRENATTTGQPMKTRPPASLCTHLQRMIADVFEDKCGQRCRVLFTLRREWRISSDHSADIMHTLSVLGREQGKVSRVSHRGRMR
jgi:hypothetical protein